MGFCGQVKAAIFGGSFNPVHCGHLALAEEVLKVGYDKILFVPAFKPPHKNLADNTAGNYRIDMLRLALEGNSRTEIWDMLTTPEIPSSFAAIARLAVASTRRSP